MKRPNKKMFSGYGILYAIFLLIIAASIFEAITGNRPLWYVILSIIVGISLLAIQGFEMFDKRSNDPLVAAWASLIVLFFLEIHIGTSAVMYLRVNNDVKVFYFQMILYLWIALSIGKQILKIAKIKRGRAFSDELHEYRLRKENNN